MNMLNRLDEGIARIEYWVMVALVAALTLILVAQVVLRYFFSSPIFWAEDVAVQILTLVSCLGVSYLIYQNDMVKVDFLLSLLPERALGLFHRVIYLISFVTLAVVCFYAAEWLLRPENRMLLSSTTGLPKWYNHLGMIVCFHLMALHLLVKLLSPVTATSATLLEDAS